MFSIKVKDKLDILERTKVILKGNWKPFMNIAGETTVKDIVGNILQQRTPEGGKLKENSPKTKEIKRKYLGFSKSLIWFKVLVNPATWIIKSDKQKVQVKLKPERASIGASLEKQGYRFFGFSAWVKQVIFKKWSDFIRRGLR